MTDPVKTSIASPGRRAALTGLMLVSMGAAIFTLAALAVVATFVIDEFGLSKEQFGLVVTVSTVLGAVLSPLVGRMTDALGAKRAFMAVLTLAGLAYLTFAVAPFYGALFVGAVVAGLAHAGANPATNKLIALHIPAGRRGVVTGLKQSGVQLGTFLGGVVLPSLAILLGWRWALAVTALVPLLAVPLAIWLVPADRQSDPGRVVRGGLGSVPRFVWWLAGYGLLLGVAGSATFFIPLFVEEALGGSPRLGGVALGVVGLAAFFGRIEWARRAETSNFTGPLARIALLGAAAAFLLLWSSDVGFLLLWPGVILVGSSTSSWNSVGMLAAIQRSDTAIAGSATGIVMIGFLVGLGIGPPVFGRTVDVSGGYDYVWIISGALQIVALVLVLSWRRTRANV